MLAPTLAGLARRAATVGATNSARNLGRKRPVIHSGAPASAVCLIRRRVTLDLDAEVASILEAWAADARVREGEIVDHAIRAMDLRALGRSHP